MIKKLLLIVSAFLVFSLCSCGSGSNSSPPITSNNSQVLTIDSTGIVPVFPEQATSSIVFIHNNSDQTLSNIHYSTANNLILENSCHTIAAHARCSLGFITPRLKDKIEDSDIISADYTIGNTSYNTHQLINYRLVRNQDDPQVSLNSGVKISNSANELNYGTVYVYAGGINQDFPISLKLSEQNFKLVNNYINSIKSGEIIAVEISSARSIKNQSAVLSNSNGQNSKQFGSVSPNVIISALPDDNGAVLVAGLLPVVNVLSNPSGWLTIINSGNQRATLSGISPPAGLTIIAGTNQCSTQVGSNALNAGSSCNIYFTTNQIGGSGNITVDYTGGQNDPSSLAATINWYNPIDGALLTMVANPNPLEFTVGRSESTTITMSNIGGYDLSSVSVPNPITFSGSGVATISTALNCQKNGVATGTNLPVGGICTYSVMVSESNIELNKIINLGITGSYTNGLGSQTYSRITALDYSGTPCESCVIFLTTSTYAGNLGGISGADAKCQNDAKNTGVNTGKYKALITYNTTRRACTSANCTESSQNIDWVMKPNTSYYRVNRTTKLLTTNSAGIYNFTSANMESSLAPGSTSYRTPTGMTTTWLNSTSNCSGWTASGTCSIGDPINCAAKGKPEAVNDQFININSDSSCSTSLNTYLMCVQQ